MSTQDTAALIASVNGMTATVAGKMGQIDQKVTAAEASFNAWKAAGDQRYINTSTLKSGNAKVENFVFSKVLGVIADTTQPTAWLTIGTFSDSYAAINFELRCLYENNAGDALNTGTTFDLPGSYAASNRSVTGVGSAAFECRVQDDTIQIRLVSYPKGSNPPNVNIIVRASVIFSNGSFTK